MWRILSVIAGVASFIGIFLYWGKKRQSIEDDHYYLYGDSLHQGALEEKTVAAPQSFGR